MQLKTSTTIEAGVYKAVIHTSDWSERDLQLIARTGEPTIDVGGTFSSALLTADFELDNRYVGVRSESPFTCRFDSRDSDDAENRAIAWAAEIYARIVAAVTELRAREDTFTGETVVTI